jgi:voltage-gated potassium channel
MRVKDLKARLLYRKEAFRQKISSKIRASVFLMNFSAIILLGSLAIFLFERGSNPNVHTYFDALWLTFVTITTVGYGDSYPITPGGRFAVVAILGIGIALVAIFVSTRAAMRVQELQRKEIGLDTKVKSRGHYVVCGWNQRGRYTLDRLKAELEPKRTQIVLLCDLKESPYNDDYVFFVRGSAISERDLNRANIGEAHAAILLADDTRGGDSGDVDSKTVLAALTIRALNSGIKMTAEMLEPENVHHLELAGVGEILDSNVISGNLLAQSAVNYGLIRVVTEFINRKTGEKAYRMKVTEQMAGMTREQLVDHLENEYGARLLAVMAEGHMTLYHDDIKLAPGDVLVVTSEREPPRGSF